MSKIGKKLSHTLLSTLEIGMALVTVSVILYFFVIQPFQISGASMQPTYMNGEIVLADKFNYKHKGLRLGEVVIFSAPEDAHCPEGTGCDFVKRVIGIPGDRVEIVGGALWVNGVPIEEPYLPEGLTTEPGAFMLSGPVTVPANSVFLVGDNRPQSSDSRAWGPVSLGLIKGRVILRIWPWEAGQSFMVLFNYYLNK